MAEGKREEKCDKKNKKKTLMIPRLSRREERWNVEKEGQGAKGKKRLSLKLM